MFPSPDPNAEPEGYEFRHGPRDGEILDGEPGELDLMVGQLGGYAYSEHVMPRKSGPPRKALQWHVIPGGGRRGKPSCTEPCSPTCPANGLAAA